MTQKSQNSFRGYHKEQSFFRFFFSLSLLLINDCNSFNILKSSNCIFLRVNLLFWVIVNPLLFYLIFVQCTFTLITEKLLNMFLYRMFCALLVKFYTIKSIDIFSLWICLSKDYLFKDILSFHLNQSFNMYPHVLKFMR